MTPHESLNRALLNLADTGRRTPCQRDPGPFTSDDWHERADATEQCRPCPVLAACDAVGVDEAAWVWAGVDRTPTTRTTTPNTERNHP